WKMRPARSEGKHMFNKRLTCSRDPRQVKKKSRGKAALRSLTGRRQTKWLQPLGKNPDHWMGTVSARKGKQSLNGARIFLAARPTGSPELTLSATLSCRPVNGRNRDEGEQQHGCVKADRPQAGDSLHRRIACHQEKQANHKQDTADRSEPEMNPGQHPAGGGRDKMVEEGAD